MDKILGQHEEAVLLIVLSMQEPTTASAIRSELHSLFEMNITVPAVNIVLKRLKGKGLVTCKKEMSTGLRGGRWRHIYTISDEGIELAYLMRENRAKVWRRIEMQSKG